MKTARISGLVVCFLLLGGWAAAQEATLEQSIVTVRQTADYLSNNWLGGPWFVQPDWILDHSPFYRMPTEDWGWTHNVSSLVPATATGIQSATLTIIAWDVDTATPQGADHVIIAGGNYEDADGTNTYKSGGTELGLLDSYYTSPIAVDWPDPDNSEQYGYAVRWSVTTFNLPQSVLDQLWSNRLLKLWMNIDRYHPYGTYAYRVTLKSSVLTIKYTASGPAPASRVPVHRFWSPTLLSHFFTIDEAEKQYVEETYPWAWTYEGVAFYVMADQTDPRVVPVYRFWSQALGSHHFTVDEMEKDNLISEYPDVWTFEGIAFYAFPIEQPPSDGAPVYRFLWEELGHDFFTIDAAEKQAITDKWPDIWGYEGVAWYAYTTAQ